MCDFRDNCLSLDDQFGPLPKELSCSQNSLVAEILHGWDSLEIPLSISRKVVKARETENFLWDFRLLDMSEKLYEVSSTWLLWQNMNKDDTSKHVNTKGGNPLNFNDWTK